MHDFLQNFIEDLKDRLLVGERLVLSTLCFDLNISHPYRPLVLLIKKLKISKNSLAQVSWNFLNDSLRTTLCLQFKPHVIAAGAFFLASKFLQVKLPIEVNESHQWKDLEVLPSQLEEVSSQLLELYERSGVGNSLETSPSSVILSSNHVNSKENVKEGQVNSRNHFGIDASANPSPSPSPNKVSQSSEKNFKGNTMVECAKKSGKEYDKAKVDHEKAGEEEAGKRKSDDFNANKIDHSRKENKNVMKREREWEKKQRKEKDDYGKKRDGSVGRADEDDFDNPLHSNELRKDSWSGERDEKERKNLNYDYSYDSDEDADYGYGYRYRHEKNYEEHPGKRMMDFGKKFEDDLERNNGGEDENEKEGYDHDQRHEDDYNHEIRDEGKPNEDEEITDEYDKLGDTYGKKSGRAEVKGKRRKQDKETNTYSQEKGKYDSDENEEIRHGDSKGKGVVEMETGEVSGAVDADKDKTEKDREKKSSRDVPRREKDKENDKVVRDKGWSEREKERGKGKTQTHFSEKKSDVGDDLREEGEFDGTPEKINSLERKRSSGENDWADRTPSDEIDIEVEQSLNKRRKTNESLSPPVEGRRNLDGKWSDEVVNRSGTSEMEEIEIEIDEDGEKNREEGEDGADETEAVVQEEGNGNLDRGNANESAIDVDVNTGEDDMEIDEGDQKEKEEMQHAYEKKKFKHYLMDRNKYSYSSAKNEATLHSSNFSNEDLEDSRKFGDKDV